MLKKIAFFLLVAQVSYCQELIYNVDLHTTSTHKVKVSVELKKLGAKTVTYQMPIWAPGAYSVTHYGHYVSDFKAFDTKKNSLHVKQVNDDRWEISDAKNIGIISYYVSDSHKDSTSLYFALAHIDTNFFFANGTCLYGYVNDKKNIPSLVEYHFPQGWKLATALESRPNEKFYDMAHPDFLVTGFYAKNYDELADAPIMAGPDFQTRTFKDGKAWYDIVLSSDRKFEMDSLEKYTKEIVHAETDFFHDTPFKHYTFLIFAPTFFKSPSPGQGALEHANSSDYLLINLPWKQFKQFGPQILAHEFFHLWNVKRIHSSLLGPFDYTKRVMTTSLWLSEGITDYYSHILLTRSHILPYSSFETGIGTLIRQMNASKSAKEESLEQLSIDESDLDMDKATVFYFKGTLVGLLLDIEIRSRTNNKKSLDDVMLALNADAKKGKTFKDKELIGKMEKITGLNLQDFYHKYIAGTDPLPMDEYLKKMGVGKKDTTTSQEDAQFFGGDVRPTADNQFIFYSVIPGGSLDKGGVEVNDTIKKVNGEDFSLEKALELGHSLKPPQTVELDVARPSGMKHLSVLFDKPKSKKTTGNYHPLPEATPLEVAIRHGIVGQGY